MPWDENALKKHLKDGLARLYVFYGEESYLSAHYAAQIAEKAVGKDDMDGFNLQRFDGQSASFDQIESAAEALPLLAERKCVLVRDYDVGADAVHHDRLLALVSDPPAECVLVFWQDAVQPDGKKSAKWKAFLAAAEKSGVVVRFDRRSAGDMAKLLVVGARKRGHVMQPETAQLLVERCGNDMRLLLHELDKLSALAGDGEITREHVEAASPRNLEASVFHLSKAILRGSYEQAYGILNALFFQREEPVSILAQLSTAYADLYRAKAAAAAGVSAESLAASFPAYKGKEFRLRNAARDCARLPLPVLRQSLDVLAQADTRLKSSRTDKRLVLEKTAAQLIVLAKGGKLS